MSIEPTITALGTYQLLRAAHRENVVLCDLDGLPSPQTSAPSFEERSSFARHLGLWVACEKQAKPGFAMRAGLGASERSPVAFLCTTRPTVHEGLNCLVHYWPTVTDGYRWVLREGKGGFWLEAECEAVNLPGLAAQLAYDVADFVQGGVVASGGEVRPSKVWFVHDAKPGEAVHACDALGVDVAFGAQRASLFYSDAVLSMALKSARPALETVLQPMLEALLVRFTHRTWSDDVRAVLPELLGKGMPGSEAVALKLGVGRRTLERRLRAEGTSFRRLLDDVRAELAQSWLEHQSIQEVAFRLCYSEPRAFHRAFKRWTGMTPDMYRRLAS